MLAFCEKNWRVTVKVILLFIGIYISGALSLMYLLNAAVPCGVFGDCNALSSDPRSQWQGVPLPYIGLVAYSLLLICTLGEINLPGLRVFYAVGYLGALIGSMVSLYLTYIAFFDIGVFCPWCMASAFVMLALLSVNAYGACAEKKAEARLNNVVSLFLVVLTSISLYYHYLSAIAHPRPMLYNQAALEALHRDELIPSNAVSLGPTDASKTVIVFSDFQCPACSQTLPKLIKIVKERGDVRLVYRHYPLPFHDQAFSRAVMSEIAAEKGLFWSYFQLAKDHPNDVLSMHANRVANMLNINLGTLKARMDPPNDLAKQRVRRDLRLARKLQLQGTPTFILYSSGVKPQVLNMPAIEYQLR